jgi:glucosyl-3-phosphoglycerate synthase
MPEIIRPAALRVLLPVLDGIDAEAALPIAVDLAGPDGAVILLSLLPPPREGDLSQATNAARAARKRLRTLTRAFPSGVAHEEHVRTAATPAEGVRQAVAEGAQLLLLVLPRGGTWQAQPYESLMRLPPCETVLARLHPDGAGAIRSALVSARGGPNAELALDIAQRISRAEGARLTVLHVDVPGGGDDQRRHEQQLFQALIARSAAAPRVRASNVPAESAVTAIRTETARHDLLVLGARIDQSATNDIGEVPSALLDRSPASVLVVKTGRAINPAIFRPRPTTPDATVDAWFVENTLHCRDYADLDELLARKQRAGLSIGVALIAGYGMDTIPAHARTLLEEPAIARLIDELVLFAGEDPTAAAEAASTGLRFHAVRGGGPDARGLLMRASLERLRTDIVVWIDADIRNPHPKLVYGLVGPLLSDERLQLATGFYHRPDDAPEDALVSLVDEFGARPPLNLLFPELSGLISPLCSEKAVRRDVALALPSFPGAAAPLALLLDAYSQHGLSAIAQVALEDRIARPLDLADASRLAFSVAHLVALRAGALPDAGDARAPSRFRVIRQESDRFVIDRDLAHEAAASGHSYP